MSRPHFSSNTNLLIVLVSLIALFCGGGTLPWASPLIMIIVGIVFFLKPPRHNLGKLTLIVGGGALLWALSAFLPETWMSEQSWREKLEVTLQTSLPWTHTPQPWVSLESFLFLLLGVFWIFWCGNRIVHRDMRKRMMTYFSVGVIFFVLLSFFFTLFEYTPPFWDFKISGQTVSSLGFFPNRNQTGTVLALAGISAFALAFSCLEKRGGKKDFTLWLLGVLIILYALVACGSRAGIVFFFLGGLVWVGLSFKKSGTLKIPSIIAFSFFLIFLSFFIAWGGNTLERFRDLAQQENLLSTDTRILFYQNVMQAMGEISWFGLSIGNFDPVFAQYQDYEIIGSRLAHPESDIFWIITEMGWPAIFFLFLFIGLLIRPAFPLTSGTDRRMRLACLVAVVGFLINMCVDVPAHRMGSFLSATVFWVMSLSSQREMKPLSKLARQLWKGLGVFFIFIGGLYEVSALGWCDLPTSGHLDRIESQLFSKEAIYDNEEIVKKASQGLEIEPLYAHLYFKRAATNLIGGKKNILPVILDFRRARVIKPNDPDFPYQEGCLWLSFNSSYVMQAWVDRLYLNSTSDARKVGYRVTDFSEMFRKAKEYPLLLQSLRKIALEDPALILRYWLAIRPPSFQEDLDSYRENQPYFLEELTGEELNQLLGLWLSLGDKEALSSEFEKHEGWKKTHWKVFLKLLASQNNFEQATSGFFHEIDSIPTPQIKPSRLSLEDSEKLFFQNPKHLYNGWSHYVLLKKNKASLHERLYVLQRLWDAGYGHLNYLCYELAQTYVEREQYKKAWQIIRGRLETIKKKNP